MKKTFYNEFEEDTVNEFGEEVQLCTTKAKKNPRNFVQFTAA